MKSIICFLFVSTFNLQAATIVDVPKIASVNEAKQSFIHTISETSQKIFKNERKSAIAPFGGVKVTPFLELDLQELIIITNSFVGTHEQIMAQFNKDKHELRQVLSEALRSGSMSSNHVLSVNIGAQLLSRLKLELGIGKVNVSNWAMRKTLVDATHFEDRRMSVEDTQVATTFDFTFNNRPARLVLISSYITSQGLPEIYKSFIPTGGLNWVYLSADGLGHFSAKANNGLQKADNQLLESLKENGAIILDYPTDSNYWRAQEYSGISFMNGRMDLEDIGLKRLLSLPINRSGIFGYCLKPGDEVRVYQKDGSYYPKEGKLLHKIGKSREYILK